MKFTPASAIPPDASGLTRTLAPHGPAAPGGIFTRFGDAYVASALSDARLYGDAVPIWRQCISASQAAEARARVIKRLRRARTSHSNAAALATTLEHCTPPQGNCRNAACPPCGRAFQRHLVEEGQKAFSAAPKRQLFQLTVVPDDLSSPLGQLLDAKVAEVSAHLQNILTSVDSDVLYLGGWDISLNDFRQTTGEKLWQPHVHLVVDTRCKPLLLKNLSNEYASDTIHFPVKFEREFDNSAEGLSYLFKAAYFEKKIFYRSSVCGEQKQRKVQFSAKEEVELYLWLASLGLAGRLISNVSLTEGATME